MLYANTHTLYTLWHSETQCQRFIVSFILSGTKVVLLQGQWIGLNPLWRHFFCCMKTNHFLTQNICPTTFCLNYIFIFLFIDIWVDNRELFKLFNLSEKNTFLDQLTVQWYWFCLFRSINDTFVFNVTTFIPDCSSEPMIHHLRAVFFFLCCCWTDGWTLTPAVPTKSHCSFFNWLSIIFLLWLIYKQTLQPVALCPQQRNYFNALLLFY